jgi:hypothetical protein
MDRTAAVAARFLAVNGEHEMTAEDDAYADAWYVSLDELAGDGAEEIRRLMLAGRLPLPSYIRSDATQMVPSDLLALMERAGSADALPAWFASHWTSPAEAVEEWDAYLSGQYVCLRVVSPENIKRKTELAGAIEALLAAPEDTPARLHALVDELDTLEPPFAPYDRRRFGGPVSRDRLIDDVRRRYPAARSASPAITFDS